MKTLSGAVAVVTGGGSGIGRGTALALAESGADVVVADINEQRANDVANEVLAIGAKAIGVRLDVRSQDDFDSLRDVTLSRFGRVDVVMNNVGLIAAGLPEQIPMSEWERIIDTNLLSIVRSNHTFLPLLIEQKSGHIVNTSSTAGLFAYSYERTPYSATKGAVVALSESLALYLNPIGVGVTCLCPGPVKTNIGEGIAFSGEPVKMRPPAPGLDFVSGEEVGHMVCQAIIDDQFLLLTHPELQEILVRRAADHQGFIEGQISAIASDV